LNNLGAQITLISEVKNSPKDFKNLQQMEALTKINLKKSLQEFLPLAETGIQGPLHTAQAKQKKTNFVV
jgi:hypothetical protein